MNKTKILSVVVATIIIGLGFSSISGAEKIDEISIDVEVKEWLGIVTPKVNIDSENIDIEFGVDIKEDGNTTTYQVNDTLTIDLDITDISGRDSFFLPKVLIYNAIILRKLLESFKIPKGGGLFSRIIPVKGFETVDVANSTLGGVRSNNLNITTYYPINNNTYASGESLTMHLFVMGFLPGSINGISDDIPIISHSKVNLNVSYYEK